MSDLQKREAPQAGGAVSAEPVARASGLSGDSTATTTAKQVVFCEVCGAGFVRPTTTPWMRLCVRCARSIKLGARR